MRIPRRVGNRELDVGTRAWLFCGEAATLETIEAEHLVDLVVHATNSERAVSRKAHIMSHEPRVGACGPVQEPQAGGLLVVKPQPCRSGGRLGTNAIVVNEPVVEKDSGEDGSSGKTGNSDRYYRGYWRRRLLTDGAGSLGDGCDRVRDGWCRRVATCVGDC